MGAMDMRSVTAEWREGVAGTPYMKFLGNILVKLIILLNIECQSLSQKNL